MPLNTIIVDDEPRSGENLRILLEDHCPHVEIIAVCNDARESVTLIRQYRPALLFLDVEMPHLDGFAVLQEVRAFIQQVIFTTAHSQYAVRALRGQALDYLLKPVDPEELSRAVARVPAAPPHLFRESIARIEKLEQQLRRPAIAQLALQTTEGITLVKHSDIIRLEAEANYTHVHCREKKYMVSRQLGFYVEQLVHAGFIRVHSSHLVNLAHVGYYHRGDGGYIVMSNGAKVEVSRSRKKELLKTLLGEESGK